MRVPDLASARCNAGAATVEVVVDSVAWGFDSSLSSGALGFKF